MGTAILQGLLRKGESHDKVYAFTASVRRPESLERLKRDLGEHTAGGHVEIGCGDEDSAKFANAADIILLGCAPTELGKLLSTPGLVNGLQGKIIVSLLAGVSYAQLADALGKAGTRRANLARVLPTLGAKIGDSVTLLATTDDNDSNAEHIRTVDELFRRIGTVQYVPEPLMLEATGIGALCHALAIVAVDTLGDASAAEGLPRPDALRLIQRCLQSASGLMLNGMSTEEMKNAMAIPTGITINSVLQLERTARPAIAESARAAVAHTRKMAD